MRSRSANTGPMPRYPAVKSPSRPHDVARPRKREPNLHGRHGRCGVARATLGARGGGAVQKNYGDEDAYLDESDDDDEDEDDDDADDDALMH